MLIVSVQFGWAKPVPVNPYRLRYGPRVGHAIVSAAGPVSNLLMAAFVARPVAVRPIAGASLFVLDFVQYLGRRERRTVPVQPDPASARSMATRC